jgi:protein dithiol oxidoreductase (disulfide-forming)
MFNVLKRSFSLALLILFCAPAWSQQPLEGKDYLVIRPEVQSGAADKIVVTEFFSYHCPHCYAFAPYFSAWVKKQAADVQCSREAVSIGHATWEASAKAFYTLQVLGKVEAMDAQVFDAIHRERVAFSDSATISKWMSTKGIDSKLWQTTYSSFAVDSRYRKAQQLAIAHSLPSVPTIVIGGKYLVQIASAGDVAKQLGVVSSLIEKVRREGRLRK